MERDLASLLSRCAANDARAWEELVGRFSGLVYAVARRQNLREDECDDVAQHVFSMLLRRCAEIRDPEALPAWLANTTRRAAWRVVARRVAGESLEERHSDIDPGEEVLRLERARLVREALRLLGGPCEALLTQLFLITDRPDYARVAENLGIPIGSIGPTRNRCLLKLTNILTKIERSS